MAQSFQPIETVWRGYRCRSRLEARWLVFFDALDIRVRYEQEGYQLSTGEWYLPDLYLPDVGWYAEIKPESPQGADFDKAYRLAQDSRKAVMLLNGPPDFLLYNVVFPHGPGEDPLVCDVLLDVDYHGRRFYDGQHRFFTDAGHANFCEESQFSPQYRAAVYAARGARFDGRDAA